MVVKGVDINSSVTRYGDRARANNNRYSIIMDLASLWNIAADRSHLMRNTIDCDQPGPYTRHIMLQ